jgi:integrase
MLTKTAVDTLGVGEIIWDDGKGSVSGFGARRQKGSAVTYLIKYRTLDGRQRWHTIGRHGSPWTVETARSEALQVLAAVKKGNHPAGAKAAAKAAPTVKLFAERFLTEHAEAKRKFSTAREYRRLVEKVIVPALGSRKVADVTRAEIQRLHHSRCSTPTEANRALALLSTMFTFAERLGERPDGSNPCRHIERFPQQRRERFLSVEEMGRLGDTLSAWHGSPYVPATIKLLVLTGARLGEVLGVRWEWIDFERGEARLPDSKTGAKTLHLPPPALDVLRSLPRLHSEPHVLGAKRGTTFVEAPWRRIRAAAGLDDVHLHDLRHSFASVAAAGGMGLPIIGKMLGHTQAQTTQRYAHLASDPVKTAAATVAARIAAAMKGSASDDGKIVPLRSYTP